MRGHLRSVGDMLLIGRNKMKSWDTLPSDKYAFIREAMERRKEGGLLRRLQPVVPVSETRVWMNGHIMVNFSSNDYLGLSKHPQVVAEARRHVKRYGAGATASRLICGSFGATHALEKKLAVFKKTERVLMFNSGFQANATIIPALADKDTLIVSDRLNHNSIIQGVKLARSVVHVAPHNDPEAMRRILKEHRRRYSRAVIVTESVFSMDGDRADIDALAALADEFSALLLVDEAHATGVVGKDGSGLCPGKDVDIIIGTLGKALGAFGAYVACKEETADYLVNYCTGFIYSTALPPAVIGAVDAALDLIPAMHRERIQLHEKACFLRDELHRAGYCTGNSTTHIIPVIIGRTDQTMALAAHLEENGILATGIREPTVPSSMARVRLSLSAAHTWDDIRRLVSVLVNWKGARCG
jgi:8-amino-7-oxononanoate synthase